MLERSRTAAIDPSDPTSVMTPVSPPPPVFMPVNPDDENLDFRSVAALDPFETRKIAPPAENPCKPQILKFKEGYTLLIQKVNSDSNQANHLRPITISPNNFEAAKNAIVSQLEAYFNLTCAASTARIRNLVINRMKSFDDLNFIRSFGKRVFVEFFELRLPPDYPT